MIPQSGDPRYPFLSGYQAKDQAHEQERRQLWYRSRYPNLSSYRVTKIHQHALFDSGKKAVAESGRCSRVHRSWLGCLGVGNLAAGLMRIRCVR